MIALKCSKTILSGVASALLMLSIAGTALAAGNADLKKLAADPGKRASPKELLALLGEFIVARDLDAIMAIHEPEAGLVEFGGKVARGDAEVRKSYLNFFKSDPVLNVSPLQVIEVGVELGRLD